MLVLGVKMHLFPHRKVLISFLKIFMWMSALAACISVSRVCWYLEARRQQSLLKLQLHDCVLLGRF